VIQPDGMDLDQSHWRGILNLRDRLESTDIDVEQIRENLLTVDDGPDGVGDERVRAQIRSEFDVPSDLGSESAERELDRALDRILDGDVEGAAEVMSEAFTTPCEETKPELTRHDDRHASSCLLHERSEPAQPAPTDD